MSFLNRDSKKNEARAHRLGRVCLFALALSVGVVSQASEARADFSTVAILIANRIYDMTQNAQATVGQIMSKYLQVTADAENKKAEIAAARTDVTASAAGDIARKLSIPPPASNFCAKAKFARGQQQMASDINLLAAAQSRGNTTPAASPAGAVKDLTTDFAYGLAPCTRSTDAEAKRNQKMGCKAVQPPWGGKWERADLSLLTIFSAAQYPVPPGFDSVSLAGYDGLPMPRKITDEKYMPFIAAYSACLKLTKRMPPLPASSSASGGATLTDVDSLKDTQNIGMCSAAQDMCKKFVFDRGQFAADANAEINKVQNDTCLTLGAVNRMDNTSRCPEGMSKVKVMETTIGGLSAEKLQSQEWIGLGPDAYAQQISMAFQGYITYDLYTVEQMAALAAGMSATVDECYSGTDTASSRKVSK